MGGTAPIYLCLKQIDAALHQIARPLEGCFGGDQLIYSLRYYPFHIIITGYN